MKKLYVLIILLGASFLVSAQSYRPFPESGYFWNETHSYLVPGSCGNEWHTCNYPVYFGTDTLINSTTYKRLLYRQICTWQNTMFPPPPFPCQQQGSYNIGEGVFACIRQDTVLKRVYVYDLTTGNESLLYQFGLAAGDTLPPSFGNFLYPDIQVVRTDSVLLADGYHRRMVLNVNDMYQDSAAIIEGIGSTFGLLAPFITAFENDDRLLCFSSMTQTLYPDTISSCDLALGIQAPDPMLVTVFPNPFVNYIDVKLGSGMPEGVARLFQADGKLVHSELLQAGKNRIELPEVSGGVYFLELETGNTRRVEKLVRL